MVVKGIGIDINCMVLRMDMCRIKNMFRVKDILRISGVRLGERDSAEVLNWFDICSVVRVFQFKKIKFVI